MPPNHSYADVFPLAPAGGPVPDDYRRRDFAGGAFFRAKIPLLALGGVLGVLAAMASGAFLARGHGEPSSLQIWSLVLAIGLEMAALPFLRRWLKPKGVRTFLLGILALVGAHFLLMAPAFGSLIVLLGLLTLASALAGLKYAAVSFRLLWLIDGALKCAIGALLWLGSPRLPPFGAFS
jgi:hypothetical protein